MKFETRTNRQGFSRMLSDTDVPPPGDEQKPASARAEQFATTHWSIVLAAGRLASEHYQEALASLCRVYWYPLYAYVRRQGYNVEEAQDLTQGFFVRLLEKNYLAAADRARGKFRSFLLSSLKHFLANERDRAWAQKRGGCYTPIRLDYLAAENRYSLEPEDNRTPDKVYEREWALSLLNQVLAGLRQEFAAAGKIQIFDSLKVFLTDDKGSFSYAETAARLGMSEGAVKVAVHRLRRRYRELLHAEIALTVGDPLEIDDEIRYLLSAISC